MWSHLFVQFKLITKVSDHLEIQTVVSKATDARKNILLKYVIIYDTILTR